MINSLRPLTPVRKILKTNQKSLPPVDEQAKGSEVKQIAVCLEEELSWPRTHPGQRSCNDSILISSMTNNDARGAEAVSEREDRQ